LVSLRQERIKSGKLSESVAAYRTAADLSRKLYANGSASFLDVLDAERSLYTAEGALIQSRIALTTDTIALAKALGGGWTEPVDASKPEIVDHQTGPHLARGIVPAGD
jgi:outer membrane protein TolC